METVDGSVRVVRRRIGWSLAAGFFVIAALCVGWGIDSALGANTVARKVLVGQTDLGGMSSDQVRQVGADLTAELRADPVNITVSDRTIETDLVRLGASVDSDRLVSDAFAARTGGSLLSGPFRWIASYRRPVNLDLPYTIDAESVQAAVDQFIAPQLDGPVSPRLQTGEERFLPIAGKSGAVVDPTELLNRISGVVGKGGPYSFSLTAYPQRPELSLDSVGRVAVELNEATADPLRIRVLDQTTELTPAELRSIIDVENTLEGSFWQVNQGRALAIVRSRFGRLGDASQQARFIVVQDKPEIVPADQTLECCDDKTAALLRAALLSQPTVPITEGDDQTDAEPLRTVELLPIVTDGTKGVAELEVLGVTELVSTFTTNYSCCQNRVTNIQLFADTIRGTVIAPGEVLSLNQLVGKRTPEKGYKEAGAINLGSLEPQYGGGISQAITTIFNAAFFAGLDFDEYQAHSLYFSRYPEGREATISWPRPDLKLRNSSEYGVLIWTEHTSTSITVSMYSTKHIEVEDLPVTRRSQGECRRVTTPRTRTYPDGSVETDEVFAVYRPAEGLDCNGNPSDPDAVVPTTRPPATTPPTTAAPVPTIPVPTTPVPTTAAPTTAAATTPVTPTTAATPTTPVPTEPETPTSAEAPIPPTEG